MATTFSFSTIIGAERHIQNVVTIENVVAIGLIQQV